MKNFTKIILLNLVMLITAFSANAQSERLMKKAHEQANKVQHFLNLEDEMTEKVYEAYLDTYISVRELAESAKSGLITEEERKVQSKSLWKENNKTIESILGPELKEAYRIHRKKMREAKER